jgi:hypothetical protein
MLLCVIQRQSERLTLFVWSVPKSFIKYHPTPIGATCFFFCYISINCLKWIVPKMLLCIIQRRSERLALFVWSVPNFFIKYHPTPIGATCFFVCFISINCLKWIVPKCYYVSSNADRSDSRFSCGVYPIFLSSIIQRRSEPLAFFVCYISINCLKWIVPKMLLCIIQRRSERLAFSFVIYQSTA